MAWACSAKTNVELVTNMLNAGLFKSERVGEALKRVDRVNYVRNKAEAYSDSPQQVMSSSRVDTRLMQSFASRARRRAPPSATLPRRKVGANLDRVPQTDIPDSNNRVLDVGSGSGYTCAIFHHLVNPTGSEGGQVVGIDHISELVDWSVENLKRDGLRAQIESGAIKMVAGDGRLGYPASAPYNVIHVGAAASTMPQPLIDQLAKPGRMFIPGMAPPRFGPDGGAQYIYQVDKDQDGNVKQEKLFGVRYVPLTEEQSQRAESKYY
ncbi:hypothetical protein FRC10_009260 [Ceratobasidium sp. 414]|nr:hypothetical protein FRC10_009260 [Ceratobasidium sp. 414]